MSDKPKISEMISDISADVKTIVRGEIELAKAEVIPQIKAFGLGAGLFGAAGYFALIGAGMLFTAFALGTGLLLVNLGGWALLPGIFMGFLIWAVIFFVTAGVLALIGKKKVGELQGPKRAIEFGTDTMTAVSSSVAAGKASANNRE